MALDKTSGSGYPLYSSYDEAFNVDPIEQLHRHEGYKETPYRDRGNWAIGYGTQIAPADNMSREQAARLADMRYGVPKNATPEQRKRVLEMQSKNDYFMKSVEVREMLKKEGIRASVVQHRVLTNMAYNLGMDGLKSFKSMFKALKKGDTAQAAYEILNSKYAEQVKDRALELHSMMRNSMPSRG